MALLGVIEDRVYWSEQAPCSLCDGDAYSQVWGEGWAHSCCVVYRHLVEAGKPCPSCRIARDRQPIAYVGPEVAQDD